MPTKAVMILSRANQLWEMKAPPNSELWPRTGLSIPNSGPRSHRHEHTPHNRRLQLRDSGSGGKSCRARRAARGLRLGLREVSQDRVHDIVVNDERDDPHLPTAIRAHQGVRLVNTLDQLRPAPAEGAGVAGLDTSRTGGRAGARAHNLPIL